MKKYKKITFDKNPDRYIYFPADNKGSMIPDEAIDVVLKEGEELCRAVAFEEFQLKEKRERLAMQDNIAIMQGKKLPEITSLFSAFEKPDNYIRIMNHLNFKKVTLAGTYIWSDTSKGRVKAAIDLLNWLEQLGYFVRNLSENERRYILLYDFHLEAGKDHVKRRNPSKPGNYFKKRYNVDLIPATEYF